MSETADLGLLHRFVPGTSPTTLLLLHGTGGDENDLLQLGQQLLPGAALLSPRGQVLEGGMPRFFRRLAPGVFDLDDLRDRTHELAEFVAAAARAYELDAGRIVALGYSNGANIAASLLLLRPGVLAGAALLRPMVPLVPEPLPDLRGLPVLIAAGQHDTMVAPDESERLAELLRQAGAEVALLWSPAGHGLTAQELQGVQSWLEELG